MKVHVQIVCIHFIIRIYGSNVALQYWCKFSHRPASSGCREHEMKMAAFCLYQHSLAHQVNSYVQPDTPSRCGRHLVLLQICRYLCCCGCFVLFCVVRYSITSLSKLFAYNNVALLSSGWKCVYLPLLKGKWNYLSFLWKVQAPSSDVMQEASRHRAPSEASGLFIPRIITHPIPHWWWKWKEDTMSMFTEYEYVMKAN